MVTKVEEIKQELLNDADGEPISVRDGLPVLHREVLASIKSFEVGNFDPTGWEPEITKDDTLVFDISIGYDDVHYVFALHRDSLTWHLLKTGQGPDGLVCFEDCQGKKHDRDSYIEALPVKYILRNVSQE